MGRGDKRGKRSGQVNSEHSDEDTTPRKSSRKDPRARPSPEKFSERSLSQQENPSIDDIYDMVQDIQEQLATVRYEQLQIRKQLQLQAQQIVQTIEEPKAACMPDAHSVGSLSVAGASSSVSGSQEPDQSPPMKMADATQEKAHCPVEESTKASREKDHDPAVESANASPEKGNEDMSQDVSENIVDNGAQNNSPDSFLTETRIEPNSMLESIMAVQKPKKERAPKQSLTRKRVSSLAADYPCMSKYHADFSDELRHASRECSFCSKCHLLEILFNGDTEYCIWRAHTPSMKRLRKNLMQKPNVLVEAEKRFEMWQSGATLDPIEIPEEPTLQFQSVRDE